MNRDNTLKISEALQLPMSLLSKLSFSQIESLELLSFSPPVFFLNNMQIANETLSEALREEGVGRGQEIPFRQLERALVSRGIQLTVSEQRLLLFALSKNPLSQICNIPLFVSLLNRWRRLKLDSPHIQQSSSSSSSFSPSSYNDSYYNNDDNDNNNNNNHNNNNEAKRIRSIFEVEAPSLICAIELLAQRETEMKTISNNNNHNHNHNSRDGQSKSEWISQESFLRRLRHSSVALSSGGYVLLNRLLTITGLSNGDGDVNFSLLIAVGNQTFSSAPQSNEFVITPHTHSPNFPHSRTPTTITTLGSAGLPIARTRKGNSTRGSGENGVGACLQPAVFSFLPPPPASAPASTFSSNHHTQRTSIHFLDSISNSAAIPPPAAIPCWQQQQNVETSGTNLFRRVKSRLHELAHKTKVERMLKKWTQQREKRSESDEGGYCAEITRSMMSEGLADIAVVRLNKHETEELFSEFKTFCQFCKDESGEGWRSGGLTIDNFISWMSLEDFIATPTLSKAELVSPPVDFDLHSDDVQSLRPHQHLIQPLPPSRAASAVSSSSSSAFQHLMDQAIARPDAHMLVVDKEIAPDTSNRSPIFTIASSEVDNRSILGQTSSLSFERIESADDLARENISTMMRNIQLKLKNSKAIEGDRIKLLALTKVLRQRQRSALARGKEVSWEGVPDDVSCKELKSLLETVDVQLSEAEAKAVFNLAAGDSDVSVSMGSGVRLGAIILRLGELL